MTDHNTEETTMTTDPTTTDHDDQEQQQEDGDQEQHTDDTAKLIAESKKYRQRAQQAEQSLAELEERHTNLVRSIAEQKAAAAGIKPAALWGTGTTPESLIADDGSVDTDLIDAAIQNSRDTFGISRPVENPHQGRGESVPNESDWATAFRGR